MRSFITFISTALVAAAHPAHERSPLKGRSTTGVCSGGPWAADAFMVPSNSPYGSPFCESGWSTNTFVPITAVKTWSNDPYCSGIQFTYADGSISPVYGDAGGGFTPRSISVNYALNERFTSVTLYGPPIVGLLRHLTITANNGEYLNCGVTLNGTQDRYDVDVASGILMGVQGRSEANVISLEFLFLRSAITNVDVSNLNFPNGPTGSQDINPESLATAHYYNNQDAGNTSWTFSDQKAVTNTYTFMQASASMYGQSVMVGITAGIPMIISITASTTFMWSYTDTTTTSNTTTETTTVTWTESGSLTPHTGVDCEAVVGTGAGTYTYTSTVTLYLADGSSFTFQESGSLSLSLVSTAIVEVSEADHP